METEEEIVYSIIETAKKGNLSDDSKINERLVRGFLKIYRASAIAKNSTLGITITDECFQSLGEVRFNFKKTRQFEADLPKIIKLSNSFGVYFQSSGENIPIMSSEDFDLGLKSIINGKLPKAKINGSKGTIYAGEVIFVKNKKKPLQNNLITDLTNQIYQNSNAFIEVEVVAVLDDPSKSPDYDWTSSPYPCPSELIEEIKTKILAKEFNLILNIKVDKVTDSNDEEPQRPRRNDEN